MSSDAQEDLAAGVAANLPYLRRYARALTGSQDAGDRYAAATLEAILADRSTLSGLTPRVGLFQTFHAVWSSVGGMVAEHSDSLVADRAQKRMATLTANTREALLLHTVEGFSFDEVGKIMQVRAEEASDLVEIALREMEGALSGKVLVIEDEPIIAMDISSIVENMGHSVTGNARTRAEAVQMASSERPDLVLADIQLADNSSGIDAVNDILSQFPDLPVVFVTAFPERLLTGERPEPAFLISKPYSEEQIWSAVSQAMFFSSTETLAA
ncbi:two-component response regulator [Allgaiera indica]|uniref:CheY chemotaxis protein or a CheY-like REC (Receiver) domain n=1 Tax=Allgaiera indica TaxID=765699 RepID=A0AAN4UTX3_9RHOB|nr:response regulator [Allgaiera indica]GHE04407.1 two-component response regulator [Allgaiera indica]SDX41269.1 CheY chemotaxis protein or a CheY-like REC (receiver) domain [Allgaiera indica]